jgi:hypothetical protein
VARHQEAARDAVACHAEGKKWDSQ